MSIKRESSQGKDDIRFTIKFMEAGFDWLQAIFFNQFTLSLLGGWDDVWMMTTLSIFREQNGVIQSPWLDIFGNYGKDTWTMTSSSKSSASM